jgi:hypothetical protein
MIKLLDLIKENIFNPYSEEIINTVYNWIEMGDDKMLIKAGQKLEKYNFPPDLKYNGSLYRVMAISKQDLKLLKQGKKEITLPLSSWSKSVDGVETIYNQDFFHEFDKDTHIGVIFRIPKGNVLLDVESYIRDLPENNNSYFENWDKYQLRGIQEEEEVIVKPGQKLNKLNLFGYFDPEGWGVKKF